MMNMIAHQIILRSQEHFDGKLPPRELGYFLAELPVLVRATVSMALRCRSHQPGPRPHWLDKTADILSCDTFSHTACGRSFSYWIWQTGYVTDACWKIGENLAWGSGSLSPGEIVRLWMKSPPHREVLLLRGFHRIGLGMPAGPFQGYGRAVVVTADFSG